jgi:hypothetical protein
MSRAKVAKVERRLVAGWLGDVSLFGPIVRDVGFETGANLHIVRVLASLLRIDSLENPVSLVGIFWGGWWVDERLLVMTVFSLCCG